MGNAKGALVKTYGLRDIIGPIMVGPSSSHTAGALALASMARKLFGEQPERAVFTLYGSFAATGSGHGTDKALVAGILGLATDDPRVADAFALAKAAGVSVEIIWDTTTEVAHPNTVDIRCESREGRTLEMRGVSIGGGAAVIRRINGIDVDITGERTSVVVHQRDERGVLAHIAGVLAGCGINIANANLHRTAKRGDAYTVLETDSAVDASVRELLMDHPDIINARVVPATCAGDGEEVPVPEDAEERFARWDYASGEELLELCERENVTIAQAFRAREEALCAKQGTEAGIDAYLDRVLEVMGNAATEPLGNPQPSVGGLIGGEAAKLRAALEDADPQHRLVDSLAARAAQYALATLETNGRMGVIVATPTAGSAGVLPGVLLALRDERGFSHDQLREGILTAAGLGYLIARNASVSGAEGGCQAEVGSAAAMAAAAAVALAGGAPDRCLAAGANVMMSLLGLVCDPVGGLVEVPCQKRNATAASVAFVSAQIALSGVQNLISFDEAVAVMDEVGRGLPPELRETALGGIAKALPPAPSARGARVTRQTLPARRPRSTRSGPPSFWQGAYPIFTMGA
mgnify:CR=1 FL=1